MAPPAGTLRVWRYFAVLLGLLVILYGIVFWPGERRTPKLGLDLEGGTQVVLQANLPGGKTPTSSDMSQARTILTNRVDAQGVSNAQVVQEGNNRIVISVPGKEGKNLKDVSQAALLQFRPELQAPVAATTTSTAPTTSSTATGSASATASASTTAGTKVTPAGSTPAASTPAVTTPAATTPAASTPATTASASQSGQGQGVPLAAGSATPATTAPTTAGPTSTAPKTSTSATATASATATPSPSASSTAAAAAAGTPINQWAKLGFAPPTTPDALTALTTAQQAAVQAAVTAWSCDDTPLDQPTVPLITCDQTKTGKYLLGPVIVAGRQVTGASAVAPDATSGTLGWTVSLSLNSAGQTAWAKYTSEHNAGVSPSDVGDNVAFTLDSLVITAPQISGTINGDTQITGVGGESEAKSLANSLKFGALPISFTEPDFTNVSATLGSSQLKAGLLAGGIGLILVVFYSLLYYRALGLVTIASLIVSGLLTYAMLVILGVQINLTLTLAGIAGFIVAVGITADSFVVFFERIKDEVHEGRSAKVAVPRAWIRARRTIISADTVSLLAALILYYFAAGDVRGFAFTLGLSTVLDLVVVFLFTHPLVSLVSRVDAFGSARLSGLNSLRTPRPDLAYAGPAADYESEPVSDEPAGTVAPPASSNGRATRRPDNKPKPARSSGAIAVPASEAPLDPAAPTTSLTKPAPRPKAAKPAGATAADRAAARRGLAPKPPADSEVASLDSDDNGPTDEESS